MLYFVISVTWKRDHLKKKTPDVGTFWLKRAIIVINSFFHWTDMSQVLFPFLLRCYRSHLQLLFWPITAAFCTIYLHLSTLQLLPRRSCRDGRRTTERCDADTELWVAQHRSSVSWNRHFCGLKLHVAARRIPENHSAFHSRPRVWEVGLQPDDDWV